MHEYGAVNVERTRREVERSVHGLCSMLESYITLSAGQQEKTLPRYLSRLRARHASLAAGVYK